MIEKRLIGPHGVFIRAKIEQAVFDKILEKFMGLDGGHRQIKMLQTPGMMLKPLGH